MREKAGEFSLFFLKIQLNQRLEWVLSGLLMRIPLLGVTFLYFLSPWCWAAIRTQSPADDGPQQPSQSL